jgi:hypothetical protein
MAPIWKIIFISSVLLIFRQRNDLVFRNENNSPFFELTFSTIGFGANRFQQQPHFRIINNTFHYTLEDSWIHENLLSNQPDTLLVGTIRQSSIDSMNAIVNKIQDTLIYRSGFALSGRMIGIEIKNDSRRTVFTIWNSHDENAQKVVDILNTYIPTSLKPLHISLSGLSHG